MPGHGPTPREQEMLALQEEGLDAGEIADQLGLTRGYVTNALGRLGGTGSDRAWNDMVRHGSAQLLAALHRAHPECRP